ncbi:type VII secretion-associated serine protease mycosin [Streptomyces celluloflavus]|uniref:type VII secretion-associated serine protease mycosin n=1 Tax=Streptomyces celluloflavus TaxID=58344 RepID=UPI003460D206|nr:type VII secretion-associated serine protease mycosin [Streptomyces celluloflavus]
MRFTRTLRAAGSAVAAGSLLFGTAPVASADQVRDDQWPLKSFDAEAVWKVSTGKGVTVAVIDGPVNGQHPDLEGNVLPGKNFTTGGGGDQGQAEEGDHGTAMAALIAGHGHGPGGSDGVKGLAPDAKILPVAINVKDGSSVPRIGEKTKYADALKYAVDQGATVINMSFGDGTVELSDDVKAAISYARQHDVLMVAATGNSGVGSPRYPASAPGVLAVGAVDKNLSTWKYSNYGPHVKLTAPGVYIRSAGTETPYHLANGTSDATAYVSAAAALLRSKYPELTAGQVANRLVKTAGLPEGKKELRLPDAHYGYGFIKPYSALTKDIPAGPKNGPLATLADDSSSGSSNTPGNDNQPAKIQEKGMSTGAIIGLAACGVVVFVVILAVVLAIRRRNRRNGPPPGGAGGFGGSGRGPSGPDFAPQPPNTYQ